MVTVSVAYLGEVCPCSPPPPPAGAGRPPPGRCPGPWSPCPSHRSVGKRCLVACEPRTQHWNILLLLLLLDISTGFSYKSKVSSNKGKRVLLWVLVLCLGVSLNFDPGTRRMDIYGSDWPCVFAVWMDTWEFKKWNDDDLSYLSCSPGPRWYLPSNWQILILPSQDSFESVSC